MPPRAYGERWQVVRSLGEGGQARTFLVTDLRGKPDTSYVLKRLKNLNRIERFKREVQAIRDLSHPNIVRLFDFDLDADKPYLVTEYCAGGSLHDAYKAGRPFWAESPATALELFQQVCEGVAHAHANRIVHRDIKPENIFLRDKEGPAVVGDFGICYIDDDGTRVTSTGEVVGPRDFTAPELQCGRVSDVSPSVDVYSLGKLLYWLQSGGRILPRERHRDREFDLKGYNVDKLLGWNNVYLEHVNWLLDLMVTENPQTRRDASNIAILTREVTRLVRKEYNPIARGIPQLCCYCGRGQYVLKVKNNTQLSNMGLTPVASNDWRIAVCNKCGHVQLFRMDMAKIADWWD